MIPYCLPLICHRSSEVLQAIQSEEAHYTYFEIWIDYLSDPEALDLDALISRYPNRLLFLFRRLKLETPQMNVAKRAQLLTRIAGIAAYLDLDISSQLDDLEFMIDRKLTPQLICSYHNYQETPPSASLTEILQRMQRYAPAMVKLACFCKDETDALRLLQLTQDLKRRALRSIILGMGPHGYATRIFGTLWGNQMVFAPRERSRSSAPDQLTRAELEQILGLIGTARG